MLMEQYLPGAGFDRHHVATMAEVLDGLGMALCLFDPADRTVLWNQTFLQFFPEHDGFVHEGEHYSANLHRFYACRLTPNEMADVDRYVMDGIARHRTQSRPFVFQHRGRLLRVGSLPFREGWRVRVWMALPNEDPAGAVDLAASPVPVSSDFANLADGATVLDAAGRIVAANPEFLALYDVEKADVIMGLTFPEAVRRVWIDATGHPNLADRRMAGFIDNARFAGVPFEVELPGGRWRRVIERRMSDGTAYLSHADITVLKHQQRELAEAYRQLEALAGTDPLTGLANRRRFERDLAVQVGGLAGRAGALSLLLLDLDNFKLVNDGFGHQAGDACLQMVARIIGKAAMARRGLAARIGGEEFAILLPNAEEAAALQIAESVRQAVAEDRSGVYNAADPITASIGVSSVSSCQPLPDPIAMVEAADRALYEAKRSGRNRTVSARMAGQAQGSPGQGSPAKRTAFKGSAPKGE